MQILALSDVYFPRVCGTSTSLRALMHELQAKGHSVTLIAPAYPGAGDPPGDDVIRVSSHALPLGTGGRLMKMHRVLELTERLRSWNYDIIHVHTPFVAHFVGAMLSRRLRVPAVETWNTFYEEELRPYAPYLRRSWVRAVAQAISRFQCRGVDGLIVRSAEMRNRLQEYGVRTPVTLIPAAVETQLFQRGDGDRFRAAHRIGAEQLMLLYVGRLERSAPVEFVLQALQEVRREIPEALLVIAGEGPAEPSLRAKAEQLDLRDHVSFVGHMDRFSELLDCYNAAECFVFPAHSETHGMALLEAMAAGLPVVATTSLQTRDILSEDSHAVITEERAADFAAAIVNVLREPERRGQLAAAGRQYVQRWSASVTVEQVLDCYQEIIALHNQPERVLAR